MITAFILPEMLFLIFNFLAFIYAALRIYFCIIAPSNSGKNINSLIIHFCGIMHFSYQRKMRACIPHKYQKTELKNNPTCLQTIKVQVDIFKTMDCVHSHLCVSDIWVAKRVAHSTGQKLRVQTIPGLWAGTRHFALLNREQSKRKAVRDQT